MPSKGHRKKKRTGRMKKHKLKLKLIKELHNILWGDSHGFLSYDFLIGTCISDIHYISKDITSKEKLQDLVRGIAIYNKTSIIFMSKKQKKKLENHNYRATVYVNVKDPEKVCKSIKRVLKDG